MNAIRRRVGMGRWPGLVTAVGLMIAIAIPGAALARAEFTEFTGVETPIGGGLILDGVDWSKPVVKIGLETIYEDVTTDPRTTGTTYVSGKISLTDPATFTGNMHGTFLTVVTGDGYEGTWEGTWSGKLINGVSAFSAVAHGTGDLAGLKEMVTFAGIGDGQISTEGRILDPHGD